MFNGRLDKIFFFSLLPIIIIVGLVFFVKDKPTEIDPVQATYNTLLEEVLVIGGQKLQVHVASTEESRAQGLSGLSSLPKNEGLLFVLEMPQRYGIWMKEMNFPIDIIWLDENREVIFIKENALPSSYPEVFYPDEESLYVLEVNIGFVQENGIKEGDKVSS